MDARLKKVRDDFEETRKKMLDASNSQGALARIYKVYQRFQTERFKTQNASEGRAWAPYKRADYAEYKRKRFKSYPGAGSKMLIATSTLAGAVIGRGDHPFYGVDKHRAIFKKNSMEIFVDQTGENKAGKPFTYPSVVNEERPFMEFNEEHLNEMKEELAQFVLGF